MVSSTNAGTGVALEGITGNVSGGQGVYGVGSGALNSASTGVRGRVYGPSSTAVLAEAVNLDTTHPSTALRVTSITGYGIYALTSGRRPAIYAKNANVSTTSTAIQAFSSGKAIKGQSAGDAVTGISTKGNGVVGQVSATPKPAPGAQFALAGVLGRDLSKGANNAGVAGTSANGLGVIGTGSSAGVGVEGTGGWGVYGVSPTGFAVIGTSTSGEGVFGGLRDSALSGGY